MSMELRLSLRQTQRMIMTQSLQQAIGLLQLSRLELIQAVRQELEENPILDEEPVQVVHSGDRRIVEAHDHITGKNVCPICGACFLNRQHEDASILL